MSMNIQKLNPWNWFNSKAENENNHHAAVTDRISGHNYCAFSKYLPKIIPHNK